MISGNQGLTYSEMIGTSVSVHDMHSGPLSVKHLQNILFSKLLSIELTTYTMLKLFEVCFVNKLICNRAEYIYNRSATQINVLFGSRIRFHFSKETFSNVNPKPNIYPNPAEHTFCFCKDKQWYI